MAGNITAPAAIISSDSIIEVQLPLGAAGAQAWCEIPGAAGLDVNNGERAINESETFRGTIVQTGEKSKPEINIEIASLLPHMPVSREIVAKFEADEFLDIRWRTPGRDITPQTSGANNTVSITTGGVATFGTAVTDAQLAELASDRVPEGVCLFTGSVGSYADYIITQKTVVNGLVTQLQVVDAATFQAPSSVVSSAFFGVRVPVVAQPSILCTIMSAGNLTAAVSQAGASSQLVLRALHNIAPVTIQSN